MSKKQLLPFLPRKKIYQKSVHCQQKWKKTLVDKPSGSVIHQSLLSVSPPPPPHHHLHHHHHHLTLHGHGPPQLISHASSSGHHLHLLHPPPPPPSPPPPPLPSMLGGGGGADHDGGGLDGRGDVETGVLNRGELEVRHKDFEKNRGGRKRHTVFK